MKALRTSCTCDQSTGADRTEEQTLAVSAWVAVAEARRPAVRLNARSR